MAFTREQWDEIYAARERLATYKNKAQPYPEYTEDSTQAEPQPQVIVHIHRYSEMEKKPQPKTPKATSYKGIRG